MKIQSRICLILFGVLSGGFALTDGNDWRELLDAYRETAQTIKAAGLSAIVVTNDAVTARREEEFKHAARLMVEPDNPSLELKKNNGALKWIECERFGKKPQPPRSAFDYKAGPGGAVLPANGEFIIEDNDLCMSSRGGIGFSFSRRYSSFEKSDHGIGMGWRHSYDMFITRPNANEVVLHLPDREVHFRKEGANWVPPASEFFELHESANGTWSVYNANKIRWNFSAGTSNRWRLVEIASRHGAWGKNKVVIEYLPGSNRIDYVMDPFGKRIDFYYNSDGRLQAVRTPVDYVCYAYSEKGCLVSVESPERKDLSNVYEQRMRYEYAEDGFLTEKVTKGMPGKLFVVYDSSGRVTECGIASNERRNCWQFAYEQQKTVVKQPFPLPCTGYVFSGSRDRHLPSKVSCPDLDAVTAYEFNDALLPSKVVSPSGKITCNEYDVRNRNPSQRGNILAIRYYPAADMPADFSEKGTEYKYHPDLALTTSEVTYQINDGRRENVKKIISEYDGRDTTMSRQVSAGVATRFWANEYGEPAVTLDANGTAIIYEYASTTEWPMYGFVEGSVNGSGYLAKKTISNDRDLIQTAVRQVGGDVRLPMAVLGAEMLVERYSYDKFGKTIRRKSDLSDEMFLFNVNGDTLASFSSGGAVVLTEYNSYGRPERVLHQFAPGGDFRGMGSRWFSGRFYAETFKYDDFGALITHRMTDEPFASGETMRPIEYHRYPSGKVISIKSSDGVIRVDERDPKTGLLSAQYLQSENGERVVLRTDFRYHPNGVLKSVKDQFGGVTLYTLDGYGDVYAETSPVGVVKRVVNNAAGQKLAEFCSKDGKELSREELVYNKDGVLDTVRTWRYHAGKATVETTEKYKYDAIGNVSSRRGTHENSWTSYLYDGLGRQVATMSPNGDKDMTFWANGVPFLKMRVLRDGKTGEWKTLGNYTSFDSYGRKIKTEPVVNGVKMVPERATEFNYDEIGQLTQSVSIGLAKKCKVYNTLGKTVKEETIPLSTKYGEEVSVASYQFDFAARLVRKEVGNKALAFVQDNDGIHPQRYEVPQITQYEYDAQGREFKIVQPDGLCVEKFFGAKVLPMRMKWYKKSEPADVLKDLSFEYSILGQCLLVKNTADGKALRECEYDLFGNRTKSTDYDVWGNAITTVKNYDSLGMLRSESVSFNGQAFPVRSVDCADDGRWIAYCWGGIDLGSSKFWQKEVYGLDGDGRIVDVKLDGEGSQFASWAYCGGMAISRRINEAALCAETKFNEFLEPISQVFYEDHVNYRRTLGRFDYGYGPQGQAEYVSSEMDTENGRRKRQFSTYSQFDSYRRLVAQNSEDACAIDWKQRSRKMFGPVSSFLGAVRASRMAYDGVGNIWARYSGDAVCVKPGDFSSRHCPSFVSSAAPVLLNDGDLQDLSVMDLASNRETSKGVLNDDEATVDVESKVYDALGCLTEYNGTYWNGVVKRRVKWKLSYDPLGRLGMMEGFARDAGSGVTEGMKLAELRYSYESDNRRLRKIVHDFEKNTEVRTYTLYDQNNPSLVFYESGGRVLLREQYLWKPGTKELLMAVVPNAGIGNLESAVFTRHYFQQDKGMNVVFSSKYENGRSVVTSSANYVGFGECVIKADILGVRSSASDISGKYAYNKSFDDAVIGSWLTHSSGLQFLELSLDGDDKLSLLKIWTENKFPNNFLVYVLPRQEISPESGMLDAWVKGNTKHLAAVVRDGKVLDFKKTADIETPYAIPLGDLRGNRVVIVWDADEEGNSDRIDVREFEVYKVANNPSPISFAGQMVDQETDMYYQINRYRIVGSAKFISPDPLGDLSGANMYAYAYNNPLEWHDPDGRFPAHILIGAGIGAVLGGGMYAINCWINGTDFDWVEFGISIWAGAASGAVAAALLPVNPILAGAAAGAVGGFIYEGGISLYRTDDWGAALSAGEKGALWGVAAGACAGSLGTLGSSGNALTQFFRSVGSAGTTGALFGGARSAVDAYVDTGSFDAALLAGQQGAFRGGILGGIAGAGGFLVAKATQHFEKSNTSYARPDGYRKGVRDAAWDSAKDSHGRVRDPKTGRYMSKNDSWDMGHRNGWEFRKARADAEQRMGFNRKDFLASQNDPDHYRPELPSSNRSHTMEDHSANYKGTSEASVPTYDDFSQLISSSLRSWQ